MQRLPLKVITLVLEKMNNIKPLVILLNENQEMYVIQPIYHSIRLITFTVIIISGDYYMK